MHIHTPVSSHNNFTGDSNETKWESFILDLENKNNYPDGSIIGICDYVILDGYKKVLEFKKQGRLQNIALILPAIEYRIEWTNDGGKNINMHIIFDQGCENDIDRFINALRPCPSSPSQDDANYTDKHLLVYKKDDICNELKKQKLDKKIILFYGKNEFADITTIDYLTGNPSEIPSALLEEIKFLSNASPTLENALSNHKICESQYKRPYLHFSDAHNYSTENASNKIGRSFTWIKGDAAFETLRQALLPNVNRIRLAIESPIDALDYITEIDLKFKAGLTISQIPFCFSGVNQKISFNPGLNCIIGGRGTGKSLLLQCLAKENISDIDKLSWMNELDIDNSVSIPNTIYEYFGQNEIESSYRDPAKLNDKIIKKLEEYWQKKDYQPEPTMPLSKVIDVLTKPRDELCKLQKEVDVAISNLNTIKENNVKLKTLNDIKKKDETIISGLSTEEYQSISKNIKNAVEELGKIKQVKDAYIQIINEVRNVKIPLSIDVVGDTCYSESYKKIVLALQTIKTDNPLPDVSQTEKNLLLGLTKHKADLKTYLEKRSLSEELIQNSINAEEELRETTAEIATIENNNKSLKSGIKSTTELSRLIKLAYADYTNALTQIFAITVQNIKKLQSKSEISDLNFKYSYNTDVAKKEFYAKFISKNIDTRAHVDFESAIVLTADGIYTRTLDNTKSKNYTYGILLQYFQQNENQDIYDLNLLKYFYNSDYINYDILYQDKSLDKLSFGQRATAILLVLLIFGTKPLIIDEPETHLDQPMIAKDLVNIIKSIKKQRQLIFATHNANIVVNGDSDLVIVLKPNSTEKTQTDISVTSIENLSHREDILMLEGSKDAFLQREKKYDIEIENK